MQKTQNMKIAIGDKTFLLCSKSRFYKINDDGIMKRFQVATGQVDAVLNFYDFKEIKINENKRVDDNLYKNKTGYVIKIKENKYVLGQTCVVNNNFKSANFYAPLRKYKNSYFSKSILVELFFGLYFSRFAEGLCLHGAGINMCGNGVLFLGESKSGKTTLMKCLTASTKIKTLSDDRLILRKKNDQYWLYGTPWRGNKKFCSAGKVELKKIYFIQICNNNKKRLLKLEKGLEKLAFFIFLPNNNILGHKIALSFLADIAAKFPLYDLKYKPQPDIIQSI